MKKPKTEKAINDVINGQKKVQRERQGETGASWSTESELAFLRNVGKLSPKKANVPGEENRTQRDRRKCLFGYATAFPLRKDWGSINPVKVRDFLIQIIGKEFNEIVEIM